MLDSIIHFPVQDLVQTYGLWVLFAIVMGESMGVPMPGETALVTTAIYAGATHALPIAAVIPVAAGAAIVGDNIGYGFGRTVGFHALHRYGHRLWLTEGRLKIGQYLFMKHGGKIVFFGRFLAFLRTFAALLAGANKMDWPHFLLMNGAGGVVWATVFGGGAYLFGDRLKAVSGPLSAIMLGMVVIGAIAGVVLFRRYEHRLEAKARDEMP